MPRSLGALSPAEVAYSSTTSPISARAKPERRAGELVASLRYGRIENILEGGLHAYLTSFISRINDIGDRIASDFLLPVTA